MLRRKFCFSIYQLVHQMYNVQIVLLILHLFAVVLSQNFLTSKINSLGLEKTMEQDYPDKHKSFKCIVMSKIIKEVDDWNSLHSSLTLFNEISICRRNKNL